VDLSNFKDLFLFFRGFKILGPFVVMIYQMINGDLLRFVIIYVVFIIGFSQCKYYLYLCIFCVTLSKNVYHGIRVHEITYGFGGPSEKNVCPH
jgi:hypothetical protein